MGTHPIFESDFDCLTDSDRLSNSKWLHVTDLSGKETIVRVTGGMKVKADRDESSPYAPRNSESPRFTSNSEPWEAPEPNPPDLVPSRSCALARAGMKIGRIEDCTPVPSDSTRRKGGRRGRRLLTRTLLFRSVVEQFL